MHCALALGRAAAVAAHGRHDVSSRVAHHIDFPDYDVDELMQIANLMMQNQNYVFGPGAEETFRAYLERR